MHLGLLRRKKEDVKKRHHIRKWCTSPKLKLIKRCIRLLLAGYSRAGKCETNSKKQKIYKKNKMIDLFILRGREQLSKHLDHSRKICLNKSRNTNATSGEDWPRFIVWVVVVVAAYQQSLSHSCSTMKNGQHRRHNGLACNVKWKFWYFGTAQSAHSCTVALHSEAAMLEIEKFWHSLQSASKVVPRYFDRSVAHTRTHTKLLLFGLSRIRQSNMSWDDTGYRLDFEQCLNSHLILTNLR